MATEYDAALRPDVTTVEAALLIAGLAVSGLVIALALGWIG